MTNLQFIIHCLFILCLFFTVFFALKQPTPQGSRWTFSFMVVGGWSLLVTLISVSWLSNLAVKEFSVKLTGTYSDNLLFYSGLGLFLVLEAPLLVAIFFRKLSATQPG
ncbi:MAG: hypothetical protein Q7S87_09005 [Agitococcus sp.]|nr:hypothetical protein [Agitococcus sp.]MDO9177039.1 hypothetical protein [Agitococcus sp.]